MSEHCDGGLKMPNIYYFCYSVKMSWLYKLLDPQNYSPWKVLLLSYIQKFGGDKILHLSKEGLLYLAKKVNPFWHDILVNFSKLKNKLKVENNTDILYQSIWLNPNIKMDGKMILKGRYIENCIFFINDLVSDNNTLFSYEEFEKSIISILIF